MKLDQLAASVMGLSDAKRAISRLFKQ